MSSNTSTVPTSIELIAEGRSPCFEANVSMTYHPKQFLFSNWFSGFPRDYVHIIKGVGKVSSN